MQRTPSDTYRTRTRRDGMRRVRGIFSNREGVTRAVERLARKSVPPDAIDVIVLDARGEPTRSVPVEDEAGTLRGALIGAACGVALGVVIVVLTLAGVFGPVGVELLGTATLAGALRAILMSAVACVPLGALFGMGHWRGRKKIRLSEVEAGAVAVVVESDELAGVARRVLEEAGARSVS